MRQMWGGWAGPPNRMLSLYYAFSVSSNLLACLQAMP